ncbi:MAG: DUF1998 domain-containing protein, partial [Candidatus Lokiarchaeota archaeon]|nr:DUF1998 domain-containing protein [Candidatus Lokiarchaeota archaeon]
LDQYFMKHPDIFFRKTSVEHAVIDLKNPYIVLGHLMCASAELPIKLEEEKYFGSKFEESLDALQRHHLVRQTPRGYVYSGKIRATEVVNLNNISNKIIYVKMANNGKLLETMDLPKAYREAYKGAVLLHQGETYIVENLDLEKMIALVRKEEVDLYTNPLEITDIHVLKVTGEREISLDFKLKVAEVEVTEFYHSYVIKRYDVIIGRMTIDLPPLKFQTVAVYFTIPEWIEEKVHESGYDFNGAIHACEHAMIAMAPMFALCDRWDIGGVSSPYHEDEKKATIFIYDSYEFGIGIAEKIYELIESGFLQTTFELINDCECEDGCPACIMSPKCGNNNEPLDKKGALLILEELLRLI